MVLIVDCVYCIEAWLVGFALDFVSRSYSTNITVLTVWISTVGEAIGAAAVYAKPDRFTAVKDMFVQASTPYSSP